MKCAVEISPGSTIYIPNFIKIDSSVQQFLRRIHQDSKTELTRLLQPFSKQRQWARTHKIKTSHVPRYWVFGLCPSSGFFLNNNEKHDVSETGSVSVLRWGKTPTQLGCSSVSVLRWGKTPTQFPKRRVFHSHVPFMKQNLFMSLTQCEPLEWHDPILLFSPHPLPARIW
jgi:hypothetical protein